MLTEQQAAAQLGLTPITLKRERHRGNIEYTLIGQRMIRYTQAQLDEYLQRCRRREVRPAVRPAVRQELPPIRVIPVARPRASKAEGLAQAMAILKRHRQL